MKDVERKYYVIRIRNDVDKIVNNSRVAVGWSSLNLTEYSNNYEGMVDAYNQIYNVGNTSVLSKKRNEIKKFLSIKKGDIVAVPCYKAFYIGECTGEFVFEDKLAEEDLANQLIINYKKSEDNFPIKFQRNNKNGELVKKLSRRGSTIIEISDESAKKELEELLSSKKDLSYSDRVFQKEINELENFKNNLFTSIQTPSMNALEGHGLGFEKLVESLFVVEGYSTKILSKKCGAGKADADISAIRKSNFGEEFSTALYIQAKHHQGITNDWGLNQIRLFKNEIEKKKASDFIIEDEVVSIKAENIRYVFVTSAKFDTKVYDEASESNIILIDGERLSEMVFERIDKLDELRYKLGYIKKFEHID